MATTKPLPLDTVAEGEDLLEMIEQLKKLHGKLDQSFYLCGSCGNRHYNNFRERQIAQSIEGAIGRLEKSVAMFGSALDEESGNAHGT